MEQIKQLLEMLHSINLISICARILLALILGGSIGMDRGRHGRAAGVRTHTLVCLGATLTTLLGFYTAEYLGFSNDPLRVGAQVISGIGFLGVGTIMIRNQSHVRGLTTAAGLWATACIGLTLGAGFYSAAVIAFVAIIITFKVLSRLERRLCHAREGAFYVEMADLRDIQNLYDTYQNKLFELEIVPAKSAIPGHVGVELMASENCEQEIFAALRENEKVLLTIPHK